ncbi:hypothetical protein RRG08_020197 [Elysia crispata]|uniref:Uncharacterized protein n=1 Tax=Elysia crispata TaxID=231223 RepID=A0AAE1DRA6_9GAST|nr:hypothetical protein RRG08_020197 [Elysia crispata]
MNSAAQHRDKAASCNNRVNVLTQLMNWWIYLISLNERKQISILLLLTSNTKKRGENGGQRTSDAHTGRVDIAALSGPFSASAATQHGLTSPGRVFQRPLGGACLFSPRLVFYLRRWQTGEGHVGQMELPIAL